MRIKGLFLTLVALVALCTLNACSQKPTTPPQDFKIGAQTVTFAAPDPALWQQQPNPNAEGAALVRFVPKDGSESFLSVSNMDMSPMTSWGASPQATTELSNRLYDQILKRSEAQIEKREPQLAGEQGLELEYTYQEGTERMWGRQLYFFHNNLFWTITCAAPMSQQAPAQAAYDGVVHSFQFK